MKPILQHLTELSDARRRRVQTAQDIARCMKETAEAAQKAAAEAKSEKE